MRKDYKKTLTTVSKAIVFLITGVVLLFHRIAYNR